MEPITISLIVIYVAQKFVDQFIKDEGYGRIKKFLFPSKKYKNRLIEIITDTIKDFEKKYPIMDSENKFRFYRSQRIFEELNKFILFNSSSDNYQFLIDEIKDNDILIPTKNELDFFYQTFTHKINNDKKIKSLYIDENYKSKIFYLEEKLTEIDKKIDSIKSDTTKLSSTLLFNPSENWFLDQCEQAIKDLGKRYTRELNFQTKDFKLFEGLGRTEMFKEEFTELFDKLLIKGNKILKDYPEIKQLVEDLRDNYDEILKLYKSCFFLDNSELPFKEFNLVLKSIISNIEKIEEFYLNEEEKLMKKDEKYSHYQKYGYDLKLLREFEDQTNIFKNYINSITCKLANNPFLIIDGEAGIGKSHLLGDIVSNRIENNYKSILLLGQHFTTEESPWIQILKNLQIKMSSDSFLEVLNEEGKKLNKRIIIFIDAINEGKGKYFWNSYIRSFFHEIRKFEFLGIVLSVRSSYKDLIFPHEDIEDLNILFHTIYGFRNNEYNASKLFFRNYNIMLPSVPLLHPEFQNPLFLKLFCEGIAKAGQQKIPDGLQGITSIINFFIQNVNKILSGPSRYEYSNTINLVDRSIKAILEYRLDNNLRYVSYEIAIDIVENTISTYVNKKGTYLDDLISEGIFSKNLFLKDENEFEEGIYLAYERFEDHLICQFLLEKFSNVEKEFENGGSLYTYVEGNNILRYRGLIDAFSIQLPEKYKKEFFEVVPNIKDNYYIIESFIESLLWRKYETINDHSKDYVNDYVLKFDRTNNLFWEVCLSISSNPEHLFNAYTIHEYLSQFTMARRDAEWTKFLKYKYDDESVVKRIIDWGWNEHDHSHISDESVKMSSIALTWFLTSTNRKLRDCSTKALVNLLCDRINVLIDVLKLFQEVNDPYVYERLFAVAYGCALRTSKQEKLIELSEYIYETIFNKDVVYPHILLRDYARGVIEYSHYLGQQLNVNISKVIPPYKSTFTKEFPSDLEIDERFDPQDEGHFGKQKWGITAILKSMGVEHGRRSYGDFGRYTFQSALRKWNVSANSLSNLAIKLIFDKYGYDYELHGAFDVEIGSGRGRSTVPNERIGKKYQWLALYEILAYVSDNYIGEQTGNSNQNEYIYYGPWNPYVRDIDPTILIKNNGYLNSKKSYWWNDKNSPDWECINEEWIKKEEDIPNYQNLIKIVDDNGIEWFTLEGFYDWSEPKNMGEDRWDNPHKEIWSQIRSYIVSNDNFDKFKYWAIDQNFMGGWMPESNQRYEMFNREYYWSPAYKYFSEKYSEDNNEEIFDNDSGEFICSVIIPIENYLWEEEFDKSKHESLNIMKPSLQIFQGLELAYGEKEGEFVNNNKEVVCFDTSIYNKADSSFLIKKTDLLKYLDENNSKILWTVLGEKQILGGDFRNNYIGHLEFSGAYCFDEAEGITGHLNLNQR